MGQLTGQLDALVAEKCCSSVEQNGWAFICTFAKKENTYKTNNLQGDWKTNKQTVPLGIPSPSCPSILLFLKEEQRGKKQSFPLTDSKSGETMGYIVEREKRGERK